VTALPDEGDSFVHGTLDVLGVDPEGGQHRGGRAISDKHADQQVLGAEERVPLPQGRSQRAPQHVVALVVELQASPSELA
jgi:hypothetical protein